MDNHYEYSPTKKEALSYAACIADETDEYLRMDEKSQARDSLWEDRWHKAQLPER